MTSFASERTASRMHHNYGGASVCEGSPEVGCERLCRRRSSISRSFQASRAAVCYNCEIILLFPATAFSNNRPAKADLIVVENRRNFIRLQILSMEVSDPHR